MVIESVGVPVLEIFAFKGCTVVRFLSGIRAD